MMTKEELIELFDKHDDLYFKIEEGKTPPANPHLHAFNLLQTLLPRQSDVLSFVEHDIIYLAHDLEELASVITEEQVIELIRCGLHYTSSHDCLSAFI